MELPSIPCCNLKWNMKKTESPCCTPETQYCKSIVLQLKIKLSMTQYKMQKT